MNLNCPVFCADINPFHSCVGTGIAQCFAVKQIIVKKGQTLILTCPLRSTNSTDHLEWRNPDGFLMFFNKEKALKDGRSKILTLTQSQYTAQISDIKFKDSGVYKCLQYGNQVVTRRYKVIVLEGPILQKTEHEDITILKCSASAQIHRPRLSWLFENGLEIDAQPNYVLENSSNKITAVSLMNVKTHKTRATVKCLAYYSPLYVSPLIDFVHIGSQNEGEKTSPTLKYISTTTEKEVTPTFVPYFSSSTSSSSASSSSTIYSSSESETTEEQQTDVSTTEYSNTMVNRSNKTISETTEDAQSDNSTVSSNSTLAVDEEGRSESKQSEKGSSALLVLLVTCLICCLIVVLAFFLVRLRRAHITWKQENEENDQSVESSKSKSSSEERQKQNQQQRGRGLWATSFTKYKVDEAAENDTRPTETTVEMPDEIPHQTNHAVLKSCVRETEL
ncbi:cytotoxic and regulatory T-cell molecule isoform X2 [Hoplias malabaricus]|uniref:cytotoxic and regulatory T-cell molecule isoform X2 n=1 Tax=Hoplias malabaricus TaxID=27720 RepID=UPI0034629761